MLKIFFTFALFASAIVVNKMLLSILTPILLVGIRMFTAGVILLTYMWKKSPLSLQQLKADWVFLTGIAIFTTFVPSILKAYALTYLNTAHFTLLGSIDPFVTALYAYLLFGEKLTVKKVVGIAIGCMGVILSINLSNIGLHCIGSTVVPQLAAIGAVLFSRFGWIMVQHQLRKNRYPPAQLNGLVMLQSGIIALFATHWMDPIKTIVIPSMSFFLFLVTYTVIVGNVVAYTLYAHLLRKHNATFISLAGFSIPIFAGLYSWIFLNEPFTLQFALAAGVFFIGLLIFYSEELKEQKIS